MNAVKIRQLTLGVKFVNTRVFAYITLSRPLKCIFHSEKDSYSLFPVDGALSIPLTFFVRIGVGLLCKNLCAKKYWHPFAGFNLHPHLLSPSTVLSQNFSLKLIFFTLLYLRSNNTLFSIHYIFFDSYLIEFSKIFF